MVNKNLKIKKVINLEHSRKGFTLLEVLIASALFAMVMLLTTGTIASSSSYQGKLKAMREANEETRRMAGLVTEDVRSANSSLTITALVSGVSTQRKFKNGLALLNCNAATCTFANNALPSGNINDGTPLPASGSTVNANTLIISTKDKIKVYVSSTDNKTIYYASLPVSSISSANIIAIRVSTNIINSVSGGASINEMAINFGGYCPDDGSANHFQPYVQFFITSRTMDFDNLSKNQRALAQIKSTVTSRSYNQ